MSGRRSYVSLVDYRRVRQEVFERTTKTLLKGVTPTHERVARIARRHIAAVQKDLSVHLQAGAHRKLAEKLAISIVKCWDGSKARPEAQMPRALRGIRLREVAAAADKNVLSSRRKLAQATGLSKTTIQRSLVVHGGARPWERKLGSSASRLAAVIAANVPFDGKRVLDLGELCGVADVPPSQAPALFAEISDAKVGMQVHVTDRPSYKSSHWVVVVRGRRMSPAALDAFLERAERGRMHVRRNPMRPDQRHYSVDLQPPLRGEVEADLFAVLAVCRKTRNLAMWRRFIFASTPPTIVVDGRDQAVDLEAIVTIVQCALRLSEKQIEEVLGSAHNWIEDPNLRSLAQQLFETALHLMARAGHDSEHQTLIWWSQITRYRLGIKNGELPGRDIERATALIADGSPDEWVIYADDDLPHFLRGDGDVPYIASAALSRSLNADETQDDDHAEDELGYVYPPAED